MSTGLAVFRNKMTLLSAPKLRKSPVTKPKKLTTEEKFKQQYDDIAKQIGQERHSVLASIMAATDLHQEARTVYSHLGFKNVNINHISVIVLHGLPLLIVGLYKAGKLDQQSPAVKEQKKRIDAILAKKHEVWNIKAHVQHAKELHAEAKALIEKAKTKLKDGKAKLPKVLPALKPTGFVDAYNKGWLGNGSLTDAERDTAKEYKAFKHRPINDALRTGRGMRAAEIKQRIAQMDASIAKFTLPTDAKLKRGMSLPPEAYKKFLAMFDGTIKPGHVFEDKAFVSTSTDPGVIDGFINQGRDYGPKHHEVTMTIDVPKGTNALPIGLAAGRNGDGECELVLGRNTRFEVIRIKTKGNNTDLVIKVLPKDVP
jgi:hypothetical protein